MGLITNQTAIVDSTHLVSRIVNHPDVELVSLFGPEHGIKGTIDDAQPVNDGFDKTAGVPVYSLYGPTLKPRMATLENLDVLVFDIQDVGARFYTYITTMGLAMQAASEAQLPFVVLDRPNPLGGIKMSGYVLEPEYVSFEGHFPIPIQHGLTTGELAQMIQGERMLPGLEGLSLHVISMEGWRRDMLWPDTGLPWVKASSNMPDFETVLLYPGACFFEATSASEGRGTYEPFKLIGAPWVEGVALAEALNNLKLPGVQFEPATFTPEPIKGMESQPKLEGQFLSGIRQIITDPQAILPVETGIHVLHTFYHHSINRRYDSFIDRPSWLSRLAGTERLYVQLQSGATPEAIINDWEKEVDNFGKVRNPYLLY